MIFMINILLMSIKKYIYTQRRLRILKETSSSWDSRDAREVQLVFHTVVFNNITYVYVLYIICIICCNVDIHLK